MSKLGEFVGQVVGRLYEPEEFVGINGEPLLSIGDDPDVIGVSDNGNTATVRRVEAARGLWAEGRAADYERRGEHWVDLASQQLYTQVPGAPLFALDRNEAEIAVFFVDDASDQIVFLQRTAATVAELERGEAEQVERAAEAERKQDAFRAGRPQSQIAASEHFGAAYGLSLRDAAARILDVRGTISRDRFGGLAITIPSELVAPGDDMLVRGMQEKNWRVDLVRAAAVLAHGERVVLAALADEADDARKTRPRLDARLPDKPLTITGGVA
jgi:hypothetical protein